MMPRPYLIVLIVLQLAMIAVSAGFYPVLPDTVPTHWNIRGEIDDHGSKWTTLLLPPGLVLLTFGLLVGLPLVGPFRKNFEQFRVTYGRICVTVMAGMVALHVVSLLASSGHSLRIGAAISVVLGVMLTALGNWLGKVRRNFYLGIRTPWTLANDAVWEKTHRLGGKLFVVVGVASVLAGLLAPAEWICFVVLMGGLGVATVWLVLYSLYWYRRLGQVDDLSPRT
jgi:uncharacterized membrane protein